MAEIKDKLEGLSQTAWAEVASEIEEESVIFLDDGASEILRWVFPGGAAALLEKGALNIYRLCKNPQRKRRSSSKFAQEDKLRASAPETILPSGLRAGRAVFVTSSYIFGYERVIQDVLTKNSFSSAVLFTSMSDAAHGVISICEDNTWYDHYRDLFEEWLLQGKTCDAPDAPSVVPVVESAEGWGDLDAELSVEIRHIPMHAATVLDGAVFFPAHASLMPLIPADIDTMSDHHGVPADAKKLHQARTPSPRYARSLHDVTIHALPVPVQTALRAYAASLAQTMGALDVRVDTYALGTTAKLLAREFNVMNDKVGSKQDDSDSSMAPRQGISLVLVDRTLDLVAPLVAADSVAHEIFGNVPPRVGDQDDLHHCLGPSRPLDVCVDITPLAGPTGLSEAGQAVLRKAPISTGSIAHAGDVEAKEQLRGFFLTKSKPALMGLRKAIVQAMTKAKLKVALAPNPGKVTDKQLAMFLEAFNGNPEAVDAVCEPKEEASRQQQVTLVPFKNTSNYGLVELALAALQAMRIEGESSFQDISAAQKEILLGGLQEGGPAPLEHVCDLASSGKFSVKDIILFALFVVSLMGDRRPMSADDENMLLHQLVSQAMHEYREGEGTIKDVGWMRGNADLMRRRCYAPDCCDEQFRKGGVSTYAESDCASAGAISSTTDVEFCVTEQLKISLRRVISLAEIRSSLLQLRELHTYDGSNMTASPYRPLVPYIFEAMLDKRLEVTDVDHIPFEAGLRKKIYGGISRLIQSKPRPTDNRVIILLVVGGIAASELRYVHEIVAKHKNFTVIVGSTHFATAQTVYDDIICHERRFGP